MIRSADESLSILERALAAAGGDEADAVLSSTDRNISRFASSVLHQNMSEISADLTIRVVENGRVGTASTTSFDDAELKRVAGLALDAARRGEPLEGWRGLYAGGEDCATLTCEDAATAAIAPAAKARDIAAMFEAGRRSGVEFAGSYATSHNAIAVANTRGVRRYAPMTSAEALVIAIADGRTGAATRLSRSARGLAFRDLADEAIRRATLVAGRHETLPPGRYDIILEAPAIAEVFEWMCMISFSGQSYEDGSSFFVDHRGQRMLGSNVTITDDALDSSFLPFPFDMEGVPKRRIGLVEEGVIGTPAVDTLMSSRLGIPLTGSAVGLASEDHGMPLHLSLAAGDSSVEEMIAGTELGIWVTRFHYLNGLLEPKTALMTGMTRDGTFLIRDGQVAARLPNLRWTQSMVEAFSNVDSLSRDRSIAGMWWNAVGGVIAPAMKVRDWNITGAQG